MNTKGGILVAENVKYRVEKNYINSPKRFKEHLLFQVGKLHSGPSGEIPKHAHLNLYELTVVTSGSGVIYTNDKGVEVRKGDVYLSFPSEFHMIRSSEDDPLHFCFFAFHSDNVDVRSKLDDIRERCMLADCRVFRDGRIPPLVENLISETTFPQDDSDQLCAAIMDQIIRYVIRDFRTVGKEFSIHGVGKPEEFCYRIMSYIDTHVYTMTALSDLSEALHYNYSYVSNLFSQTTGESLSSYYRRRRLDTARLLLREGRLSITEIAELLNFSTVYTFSRAYKDYFGVCPRATKKGLDSKEKRE